MEERIPFYKSRKREKEVKIETIQSWIKTNGDKWAFMFLSEKKENISVFGTSNDNTNRLHLVALVEMLEWIYNPLEKKNVIVNTDSLYVVNCVNEWMEKWKRFDFKFQVQNTQQQKNDPSSDSSVQFDEEEQPANQPTEKERPNADLLRKIESMKSNLNILVKLIMVDSDLSNKAKKLVE